MSKMIEFKLAEDLKDDNGVLLGSAGQLIKMAVTPADTADQLAEVDTYLGGYKPFQFVADDVSPIVPIDREKGKRRDFAKENVFEHVDPRAGRQGAIKEIDHSSATTDFETEEFALASFIPYAAEADARYKVKSASGRMIMDKLLLDREIRVMTALTTVANWDSANRTTLTTDQNWNGGSDSNPLEDIMNIKSASAQPITLIAMNPVVAFHFLSHAEVRNYMRQMMGDNAVNPAIARSAGTQGAERFSIPGIGNFIIAPAKRLVAGALQYVWPDTVVALSHPVGIPLDEMVSASHLTFRYRGRSGTGVTTNEYFPQGRGLNGGTMMESGFAEHLAFPSNISGGVVANVIQ